MLQSILISAIPVALLAAQPVLGACEGGYTFGYCEDRIVHWYDPDTGEICDPLDCGGGRAPVKYDVPGCAAYTGTEVYNPTPSFMPCFKSLHAPTAPVAVQTSTSVTEAEPTAEPAETTDSAEQTESSKTQAEPEETKPAESKSSKSEQDEATTATSAQTSSSAPPTQSSGEKSQSTTASAAPTTAPATTPAPTLSTITQPSSSVASTPAASQNPDSGAAASQGSLLVAAGAALLALAFN